MIDLLQVLKQRLIYTTCLGWVFITLIFFFFWYTILRLFFHCSLLRLGGGTLGNCIQLIPNITIYYHNQSVTLSELNDFQVVCT